VVVGVVVHNVDVVAVLGNGEKRHGELRDGISPPSLYHYHSITVSL
jgi:hypothetical protein